MKHKTEPAVVVPKPDTMMAFDVQVIQGVLAVADGNGMFSPIPAEHAFKIGVGLGMHWNPIRVSEGDIAASIN